MAAKLINVFTVAIRKHNEMGYGVVLYTHSWQKVRDMVDTLFTQWNNHPLEPGVAATMQDIKIACAYLPADTYILQNRDNLTRNQINMIRRLYGVTNA